MGPAVARTDVFNATAARMSAFNALSSILSLSWKSMARLVLPSRLELKRPEGSSSEAPLAKVIFTTCLYVSPVQMIPSCDHTGTPLHFHSSTTSGSASLIKARSRPSSSPRQSPSSLILASISRDGDSLFDSLATRGAYRCGRCEDAAYGYESEPVGVSRRRRRDRAGARRCRERGDGCSACARGRARP